MRIGAQRTMAVSTARRAGPVGALSQKGTEIQHDPKARHRPCGKPRCVRTSVSRRSRTVRAICSPRLVSLPDAGSQKRSFAPSSGMGSKMNASRFALCRHTEIGPCRVIAIKAQASIRSFSKPHASMKLWTTNESLLTRPRAAQRLPFTHQALRNNQPPTLAAVSGFVKSPRRKVRMTVAG